MRVGIILPLAENEEGEAARFNKLRDLSLQAEAAGFDSLWIYDHLLHRFPGTPTVGFWESWTTLSGLGAVTQRITLGPWVSCTAFRNPALLAKMASTVDEITDGRLILGLGAGWHQPEFDAFGIPFNYRASRFEEALQIIVPLLRQGLVNFEGTYYRAIDCELRPSGPRPSGPPILVAAFGPRMLRLAARYADGWLLDWLGPPELPTPLIEGREALTKACIDVGRDPTTLQLAGGITVAYPSLGPIPNWLSRSEQFLSGPAEEVAVGLGRYADLGVAHVMCWFYPSTAEALSKLSEALRLYRDRAVHD